MNNRLQELTDKLYNEGLSKGKAEGEALLAQAKEKAAAIVEEARKEAEAIVGKARNCLLYTSPSPRDRTRSRMPSSA